MNKTKIEWTNVSWNPIRGCTPASAGCDNCYAKRMALRFGDRKFKPQIYPKRLDEPFKWKKPRMVFVGSMGDIFHDDISDHFLHDLFATMAENHRHTFQLLTKRVDRMHRFLTSKYFSAKFREDYGNNYDWPLPNVWLGITAENQAVLNYRTWKLLETPAAVRFVSAEPVLGPIDLNTGELICRSWLRGITMGKYLDWVVVGGETGPGARECREEWIQSIYDQCQAANVPFFFKSGGKNFVWSGCHPSTEAQLFARQSEWMKRREWPKQK